MIKMKLNIKAKGIKQSNTGKSKKQRLKEWKRETFLSMKDILDFQFSPHEKAIDFF